MTTPALADLSDRDLLIATERAAATERGATVEVVRLLAEVDARRLYLGEGCSSLFTYCTQVLHLSEHAAYHRIEAARTARLFPAVLDLLAEGSVTLTTVAILRPHLTTETSAQLLEAARNKSKREVEQLVSSLAPVPQAQPVVRKLPAPRVTPVATLPRASEPPLFRAERRPETQPAVPIPAPRYQLKVTLTAETHAMLRRAQDLMRHSVPNGDPAVILDRALTMLVEQLEKTKIARTSRPRATRRARTSTRSHSRYLPAAVKRAVWERDEGRCAFEGPHGRCIETGLLEFHHLVPFTDGGPTTPENLELRCRAHNQFEAERLLLDPFVSAS